MARASTRWNCTGRWTRYRSRAVLPQPAAVSKKYEPAWKVRTSGRRFNATQERALERHQRICGRFGRGRQTRGGRRRSVVLRCKGRSEKDRLRPDRPWRQGAADLRLSADTPILEALDPASVPEVRNHPGGSARLW